MTFDDEHGELAANLIDDQIDLTFDDEHDELAAKGECNCALLQSAVSGSSRLNIVGRGGRTLC